MFNLPQPILANLEVIIQAIVLLVILASGAARMFRESKEAQQRAERQRQQRRPAPQPAQEEDLEVVEARGGDPARQPPQETIRSEVEEFLRRVGQNEEAKPRKTPQPKPKRPTRQPSIEVLDEASGFEVDDRPRQSRKRPAPKPPQPTAAAPTAKGVDRGETVAEYVEDHMNRDNFVERASHLGEEVAQADERFEARLHQKFDHRLGTLSARRMAREAADLKKQDIAEAPTMADSLLDMLASPQGVQQAVLMSEVLRRPDDRW